ncbi:magnesium and cobalt transporter [Candidatus Kinetoplastibacterium desouzaii TCC079E]|uniref:Magnesium and cobalt transporter n=1 Tax=Candidatus Kinetoplastidibacterium desouzai TCC079E TaxID=1208919 RepID=M1LR84_9PROT|nr:transporter associated domain-containing protein [Candidatus Kinetoplastibacterium desouzaii]AGF46671.1 magnesium and cobalt transporter [Candidatus Kinetoplastibacterium desouzaii TCC079E]
MSDTDYSKKPNSQDLKPTIKSILGKIISKFKKTRDSLDNLNKTIELAHEKGIIDHDAFSIFKGVLSLSNKTAGDVMITRSKMNMLEISMPIPEMIETILESANSRFPVFEGEKDNIIGIILAKDLLRHVSNSKIETRSLIRSAIFIPESKKLNILLREFRVRRNHLAIVLDEHGGVSGLITMEDVLEQIVGNIEDEFDNIDNNSIFPESNNQWMVMAATDIDHFNEYIKTNLPNNEYDSVGGWLGGQLNKIPQCGDKATYDNLTLEVIRADSRRALWIRVNRYN